MDSETLFWIFFAAVVAVMIATAVITVLKAHYLLFALGFVTGGITWLIGTIRRPRPGSIWARRFDRYER